MRYESVEVTHEDAHKIMAQNQKSWSWICENRFGEVHWNSETGELFWIPNGEDELASDTVKYQRLVA